MKTEPGESAVAKVTEARIYGYPVEALCGERFVPQQDPKKLPLCGICKEIYDLYRAMGDGGLNETPGRPEPAQPSLVVVLVVLPVCRRAGAVAPDGHRRARASRGRRRGDGGGRGRRRW